MTRNRKWHVIMALSLLMVFTVFMVMESSAWARAGKGGSSGGRGSRSFSSPSMPSGPSTGSPGLSTPGRGPSPGMPAQPQGGFFSRSPFMSGLAGGLAGGLLGGMLFGGTGHASAGGAPKGGIGLLDIAILSLLLYLAWRFFKRRRATAQAFPGVGGSPEYPSPGFPAPAPVAYTPVSEVEEGLRGFRQSAPDFSEETLKETFQDLFFRIQAAWMNRSLDGIQGMLTPEMAGFFAAEFEAMQRQGRINRLENIAVRRVDLSEIWQEVGMDYVTVLITANLLDYTVDDRTGQVVGGDRSNPLKFQEFWTFCRPVGSSEWQLSGINQPGEAPGQVN